MRNRTIPDALLIEKLLSSYAEEEEALSLIYKKNRPIIRKLVLKNGGTKEAAKDVFQEAIIYFYENVKAGKFRGASSISSYLYSIAKFIWLNRLKRLQIERKFIDTNHFKETQGSFLIELMEKEQQTQLFELFDQLGTSCKELLIDSLYYNYPMKDLVEKFNYENEQIVRNKKYRCLKRLKEMLKEQPQLLQLLNKSDGGAV